MNEINSLFKAFTYTPTNQTPTGEKEEPKPKESANELFQSFITDLECRYMGKSE